MSEHTPNFPQILREANASIMITSYVAGKLILVSAAEDGLNITLVDIPSPMGLAVDSERLFVGTNTGIREYRNIAYAAYVFRSQHGTGNIDLHEMAICGDECWYVNTLFSCLCTLGSDHSLAMRWRPSFITELVPEDRCHLNGLAMGKYGPMFISALGEINTPGGWYSTMKDGGILIEYASGEPMSRGLVMPHSPRWHQGRLWVLESRRGSLGVVDLATGKVEVVAQMPGFVRGLDFLGSLAIVGLSQLRNANDFTDVPTAGNVDRQSGLWLVDTVSGKTVGTMKFGDEVCDVFSVQALSGINSPAVAQL